MKVQRIDRQQQCYCLKDFTLGMFDLKHIQLSQLHVEIRNTEPRTVKLWNKLPAYIKTLNFLRTFRNTVIKYYKSKVLTYKPP